MYSQLGRHAKAILLTPHILPSPTTNGNARLHCSPTTHRRRFPGTTTQPSAARERDENRKGRPRTWTRQRLQMPPLTRDLATQRAAYAADRSTLVGSLPEKAPPPWAPQPPYVSTMILRPVRPASPWVGNKNEGESNNGATNRREPSTKVGNAEVGTEGRRHSLHF